jgi:hypothetical protein
VVRSIAASIKIIEYEVNNTSDTSVKEFAQRVLDQHKGSVKTASGHAQRLNVTVDTDGTRDRREMIDRLSTLRRADRDAAFLAVAT